MSPRRNGSNVLFASLSEACWLMPGHSNQSVNSILPMIFGLVARAQERAERREAEAAERAAKAEQEAQRLVQERRERQAAEEEERRAWRQRRQVCNLTADAQSSACSIQLGQTLVIWQEKNGRGFGVTRECVCWTQPHAIPILGVNKCISHISEE